MGVFIVVLIILGFIGALIWQFIETQHALATTSVLSRHAPEQAARMIDDAFEGGRALLWTNTSGPGYINKRRRGYRRGVTMSIDIEELPGGGSRIDMWASQYRQYLFVLANFAGVVNRRKKAIARLLVQQNRVQPQVADNR